MTDTPPTVSSEVPLVERAKELVANATPGPWEASDAGWPDMEEEYGLKEAWTFKSPGQHQTDMGFYLTQADADFIAASPTLVTELVAALEEAETRIGAYRDALGFIARDRCRATVHPGLTNGPTCLDLKILSGQRCSPCEARAALDPPSEQREAPTTEEKK